MAQLWSFDSTELFGSNFDLSSQPAPLNTFVSNHKAPSCRQLSWSNTTQLPDRNYDVLAPYSDTNLLLDPNIVTPATAPVALPNLRVQNTFFHVPNFTDSYTDLKCINKNVTSTTLESLCGDDASTQPLSFIKEVEQLPNLSSVTSNNEIFFDLEQHLNLDPHTNYINSAIEYSTHRLISEGHPTQLISAVEECQLEEKPSDLHDFPEDDQHRVSYESLSTNHNTQSFIAESSFFQKMLALPEQQSWIKSYYPSSLHHPHQQAIKGSNSFLERQQDVLADSVPCNRNYFPDYPECQNLITSSEEDVITMIDNIHTKQHEHTNDTHQKNFQPIQFNKSVQSQQSTEDRRYSLRQYTDRIHSRSDNQYSATFNKNNLSPRSDISDKSNMNSMVEKIGSSDCKFLLKKSRNSPPCNLASMTLLYQKPEAHMTRPDQLFQSAFEIKERISPGDHSASLESLGNHPENCRPCAFRWTKGCANEKNCHFCHEWHTHKKKKSLMDQRNLMIIARPDGCIEFLRCTANEAFNRT